ncbi:MAG TPA: hypothetical protein VL096_04660, partial [Pirellulaceae bacterium]|nr:hypothetical protein [Pirellulaceae bacterium]
MSLRTRFLLCLVLVSSVVGLGGVWRITTIIRVKLEQQLALRAEAVADAIGYAAATSSSSHELQRCVTAMAAARDVELILVADERSGRVIASSESTIINRTIDALPAAIKTDLQVALGNSQERGQWRDELHSYDWTGP